MKLLWCVLIQGLSTQSIFKLRTESLMKVRENSEWADEQFGECALGNRLRTKRLVKVAAAMLSCPEKSLPKQNPRWSDLKAAYRLFQQKQVTFNAVAEPHWQQVRQTEPGRFLLISDTTDIDFFSHAATTGLGMLGSGDGRGMQLHNCLVYNCDTGLIEGNAGALLNYRSSVPEGETRMQRLKRRRESEIWGDLVEQIGSAPEGSQWIHVFDRGGDNFEAMCHIRLTDNDWIIRAAKLKRKVLNDRGEKAPLQEVLKEAKELGSYQLSLRSRPGAKARTATIVVSTIRIVVPRPVHYSPWVKECGIKQLELNVVVVQEANPPKGASPIEWVLLTSLDVSDFEDAWRVIEYYEHRWLAEEYNKVLKTGCSVETHALRTADRLEPLIALISVIGIRLLQLKYLGRHQQKARAQTHVPSSWLKCLKLTKPNLATSRMTVYEFFREVAKLGGFLGRKGDGEPGWQTTWHGYMKLQATLDAIRLAGAI